MELLVATHTSFSRLDIHDMLFSELILYIDYIQAKIIQDYETKVQEQQTYLNIYAGSQSEKGMKAMQDHFKKALYANRELDEEQEVKSNDAGWAQLIALDKKMKGK